MEVYSLLDSYLGKKTAGVLKEAHKKLWDLNYHFDCQRVFFERMGDDYSNIVGYVVDESTRSVTLYSGFLDYFHGYIKGMYGYYRYCNLLKFSKNIEETIVRFGEYKPTSKYKIYKGYLECLRNQGVKV